MMEDRGNADGDRGAGFRDYSLLPNTHKGIIRPDIWQKILLGVDVVSILGILGSLPPWNGVFVWTLLMSTIAHVVIWQMEW